MTVKGKMHELKCWPREFEEVVTGLKRFQLRLGDMDYRAGDRLMLKEFIPDGTTVEHPLGHYTDRLVVVKVIHVTRQFICGVVNPDYVGLSIELV